MVKCEASIAAVVGHATGQYISQQLFAGATVGVGWGATLKICMQALAWREIEAILAKPSPRNPSVAIDSKSSRLLSLLVAWR